MMNVERTNRVSASERGHVGPWAATIFAIAAAIVAAIGIGNDSDGVQIVGVALFALAIIFATQVPHYWMRKVYRRIDRITDSSDPDKYDGPRRIEL